jgi:MYND finger
MSKKKLKKATNDQIWSYLSLAPSLTLCEDKIIMLLCDGCGAQEEMHGDFLCCSACENDKACYCSKECQRAHWKQIHKHECGVSSSSPCRVDFHDIKSRAARLTQNYAEEVRSHTLTSVTEDQRKAAFPGLVQCMKEFLKQRPDLNSNSSFGDVGKDPEFLRLLLKYFSKQSGYEIWADMVQHPGLDSMLEELTVPSRTKLFDEETVISWAKSNVLFMQMRLPAPLDSTQSARLLDKIVASATQYVLDHPEYNSHRGFPILAARDDLLEKVVSLACAEFLGLTEG